MKNRDAKHPPTHEDAQLFVTKVVIIRQLLEQKQKPISVVCPVYFSAKGFAPEVETFLHQNGVLTTDLDIWDREGSDESC